MSTNDELNTNPRWEFSSRRTIEQVEEGMELAPKFNDDDILPCITQHVESSEVLMLSLIHI